MKRLDTTKMQELAQRAVSECTTMDEVVALVNEYVGE